MREVRLNIYRFSELTEEAQLKAYNEYLSFIEEAANSVFFKDRSDVQQAIEKCEKMKTPWFFKEYLDEINGEGIRNEIEENYEFYSDGSLFSEFKDSNLPTCNIFATNFTADGTTVTPYTIRALSNEEELNVERAIKDACKDYLNTEEGKKVLADNSGYFNIGDFMLNVPDEICKKYGFVKVDVTATQFVINEDENLI